MAEERQPPTVHEGADDPPAPVPASAEDRKAAAALSSLDARDDDDGAARGKEVDSEALGKAMQSLDAKQSGKREEEAPAKKVKIEAADVALVVCVWAVLITGWAAADLSRPG